MYRPGNALESGLIAHHRAALLSDVSEEERSPGKLKELGLEMERGAGRAAARHGAAELSCQRDPADRGSSSERKVVSNTSLGIFGRKPARVPISREGLN